MVAKKKTQIWKGYYDVVLLPPPPVQDYAIELSRQLERYGSKFVLGKRRYIPHLSLYHIAVADADFDAFSAEIRKIAAALEPRRLKLDGIEMPLLMTEKPAWLAKLHRDIVRRTSPFFDWDSGAQDSWGGLPPQLQGRAKGHIEKYGSPLIGAGFKPHITLTSFEDKAQAGSIPALKFEPLSFLVDRVYISELGPSHTCQRIVTRCWCGP